MTTTPIRGVVFCSGSASSFRYLHQHDPAYGKSYRIVGVFSDTPNVRGLSYAEEHQIPTQTFDFNTWRAKEGISATDLRNRKFYFARVSVMLHAWRPDFIILSGFMRIVTDPLLSEFWGKMLNVHPALLSLVDKKGSRLYTGLNTVKRAMDDGAPTGSTVHLLTGEPDMGPIVAESPALTYEAGDDPDKHQELMKTACDGPAFQEALEKLIAAGWPHVPWKA